MIHRLPLLPALRSAPQESVASGAERVEALVRRLCRCEAAASHIEYALIAGFAGTLLLGAYIRLADSLDGFYRTLAGLLDGVL